MLCILLEQGEPNFKDRTCAYLALYPYLSIVCPDDPLDDGKTESCTTRFLFAWHRARLFFLTTGTRLVYAIEAVKEGGKVFVGYPRSIVLHTEHAPAPMLTGEFHMHALANATGIFDGIFYEIYQHPAEILWIAGDE